MGLKLGQNINFRPFFRFLSISGGDKAFWSRQSLLVATLVATACLVVTLVATYCHAPDPGPTRLANPNQFRSAKPYAGTPYIYIYIYIFFFFIYFFFKDELIYVVYK